MALSSAYTLTVVCVVFILCLFTSVLGNKASEFDVQPGGVIHKYEEIVDNIKCTFTYACQGGTNEKWLLKLEHSPNKEDWMCSVERSGTSYLFFLQFKMDITGASIKNALAVGSNGELKKEEYQINEKDNSVTHVEGVFSASLKKLEVYATATAERQEL